ncbi:MAG: NAD-dependent epimerase/dehydratase family protein [Elusimicrobia bacterium]|nr:NAD-dependent epimerase/dehydratase family protein [Elusimicrobiota bacterium]
MKTIAVTGGTGFVGGALSKALLEKGYAVRVITRSAPARPQPGAAYAVADFSDTDSLRAALAGADAVVHLAAALFCRSGEAFLKANGAGTANLVKAAEAACSRRGVMVNAGSASGRFSFIYLDDLVRALTEALETEKFDGGTFYVCENKVYTWREFITLLSAGMGVKMPLMVSLPPWAGTRPELDRLPGPVGAYRRLERLDPAGRRHTQDL